ncbi:MAG: type IV pilus modification PilV family protein [Planctomycetota bacterium]|jgi:prepilin-type N-terminal cleavage/methylation domain-containing protein
MRVKGLDAKGFTLLEVMATLAIMAVALTVLLVERNVAVYRTARTNDRRIALQLAEEKIQEILLGLEGERSGTFEAYPTFRWTAEEDVVGVESDGQGAGMLRHIEVTVFFPLRVEEDHVTLVASVRGGE